MLRANLEAAPGSVWLVTVTAPGADRLPCSWRCDGKGEHVQSGPAGCRVDEPTARAWNGSCARRWSELHHLAVERVRRRLGAGSPVLAAVWQLQARGVLHRHLVLDYSSPAAIAIAKSYVTELRRLVRKFDFGYVDARDRGRQSTVMEAGRAAAYLSPYVAESGQLAEAVALGDRPRRLVWLSPRLTLVTGCTMRRLRRVRFLWWIRRGESSVVARAGRLPEWFRDRVELLAVSALADAARAP